MKAKLRVLAVFFLLAAMLTKSGFSSAEPIREGVVAPSRFFTKEKAYVEEMFVFNDYLEFSVFDMSKLGLFINAKQVELTDTRVADDSATHVATATKVVQPMVREGGAAEGAEQEIRALLGDIPRYFYTKLRQQIEKNKVPVTLNATNSPVYGKPLVLYIKLKKISLLPPTTDKKGRNFQPVSLKIYGQIKDKSADKILFRFYDTAEGEFVAGGAAEVLERVADQLMGDLAKFMATRY